MTVSRSVDMKISGFDRLKVLVITHFTSPYQVELFDAISTVKEVDITVVYLNKQSPGRKWASRKLVHTHFFSSDLKFEKNGLRGLIERLI